ncbi:hypothetical protein C6568_01755 [Melaminivora suipulveris]|uniref:Uncharacterized protein n=1 Tax=Melaminivora suipulveris TaxID=2109913 RepID=A0A2R3Q8M9_9BURK|nr:hypothetical protein C6568_01755 [Melaminivora suipulveris]
MPADCDSKRRRTDTTTEKTRFGYEVELVFFFRQLGRVRRFQLLAGDDIGMLFAKVLRFVAWLVVSAA